MYLTAQYKLGILANIHIYTISNDVIVLLMSHCAQLGGLCCLPVSLSRLFVDFGAGKKRGLLLVQSFPITITCMTSLLVEGTDIRLFRCSLFPLPFPETFQGSNKDSAGSESSLHISRNNLFTT